jgi:hypothetical protein
VTASGWLHCGDDLFGREQDRREKYVIARAPLSTPRLREFFPETLVWQPAVETDRDGRAEVRFKLADNITTWKMSVIASTEDGRVGTYEGSSSPRSPSSSSTTRRACSRKATASRCPSCCATTSNARRALTWR